MYANIYVIPVTSANHLMFTFVFISFVSYTGNKMGILIPSNHIHMHSCVHICKCITKCQN